MKCIHHVSFFAEKFRITSQELLASGSYNLQLSEMVGIVNSELKFRVVASIFSWFI